MSKEKIYKEWVSKGRKGESGIFDTNMKMYECRKKGGKWIKGACKKINIPISRRSK